MNTIGSNDVFGGIQYFIHGFYWLNKKGIRPYVVIPLIINIIVFSLMLWLAIHWFGLFTHWLDSFLPSWLLWLNWILWVLFVFAFIIVMTYTFTLIANLVSLPFNSFLSEKVEFLMTGKKLEFIGWKRILKEIGRLIKRQIQIIIYYLLRAIVCLILFFIPFIQVAAGPIWFLFTGWMMSIQYVDYPMDNHRIDFAEMRRQMNMKKGVNLGFGCAVMFATMIPILNFFVMPAAVIGATLLWVEQYRQPEPEVSPS